MPSPMQNTCRFKDGNKVVCAIHSGRHEFEICSSLMQSTCLFHLCQSEPCVSRLEDCAERMATCTNTKPKKPAQSRVKRTSQYSCGAFIIDRALATQPSVPHLLVRARARERQSPPPTIFLYNARPVHGPEVSDVVARCCYMCEPKNQCACGNRADSRVRESREIPARAAVTRIGFMARASCKNVT